MKGSLLKEFFEKTVSQVPDRPPCPGSIVSKIVVNHEKMFAFMEFTTCFDAEIAICMDGAKFMKHPLQIRKAKETEMAQMAVVTTNLQQNNGVGNTIANQVADGPDKILLGGLPLSYTANMVQELISQFGELKAFTLVKDSNSNMPKGLAYFAFKDQSNIRAACEGLDGRIIEGKTLLCRRAHQQQGVQLVETNASKINSLQSIPQHAQSSNTQALQGRYPNAQHSNIKHPSTQQLNKKNPTHYQGGSAMNMAHGSNSTGGFNPQKGQRPSRILKLLNMVSRDDLSSNEEYNDILLDIREECRLFGKLLRIFVPRPSWSGVPQHPDIGAIFLEYLSAKGALNAREYIKGRKFNDRDIIIQSMPEQIWNRMVKTEPPLPS